MVGNIIEKFNLSTGDIKLGEWNVHFKAGLQYAEDNNIPIYVFWSNNGCSQCTTIINSFTSDFIDGAKDLKIVLIAIKHYSGGEYNADAIAAKTWLGAAADYPISKVWWKKANGTVEQSRWEYDATPSKVGDRSNRFLNSIKDCIEGYVPPVDKFTVTFKDLDGTVISTQLVESGKSATAPANPIRDGYEFTGWSKSFSNVQSDIICIAQYRKILPPTPVPTLSAAHVIKISNNIDKLQVIGDSTYPNALQDNLISVKLGDQCKEIGPSCFMNCKSLEYVKLPENCRYIGDYAFYGCENLKYVTCLDENDCYEIFDYGAHAFDGCNSLENICFKLSSTVSRDATVGEYCFANCNNLKSFTQKGWSYLGSHMFSGCEQLTSINLQNNTNYVQAYALAGIPNLKSITIPNKMWIISEGMFAGDTSLTSVNINDGNDKDTKSVMMLVGDGAFASCDSLTSITLPESINDISCCGDFMLKDSNISTVTFNGMPDDKFITSTGKKITLKDGYIQDKSEFKTAVELAIKYNVPMVIFTNHASINGDQGGCPVCQRLVSHLRTAMWKDFMEKNANKCIFVYANSWRSLFNAKFSSKNIKIPWSDSSYFAKAACVWYKTDGKTSIIHTSGYAWGKEGDPSTLISKVTQFIDGADSDGAVKVLEESIINQSLTKLGSSLEQVTYISKEGNSHIVTKDTYIETIPNTRVDKTTKDNFRYGTWYYNAEELRAYADENGIPVLCEYSKDGCSPCMYFRKNVFKNRDFQDWVMSRPYLFCRIEIEENDNFNNKFDNPEAYYIDKVWAKEIDLEVTKKSIPIFFWYWSQNGVRLVGDLSSYHFNPDVTGAKPPFSMEDIMQQTDSKFINYLSSADFKRYETYDLYSNASEPVKIGQYADNIEGDNEGIMFPCDAKVPVQSYAKTLMLSGYPTLQSISVGQEVPYDNYTYYVYDVAASQSYNPDAFGVIFKVELSNDELDHDICVITHILETANDTDVPYKPDQKYQTSRWYDLTADSDATAFNSIIAEAEDIDYPVVILKTSDDSNLDEAKSSTEFNQMLKDLATTYFIEARSTNWSVGIGNAFKQFQTAEVRQRQDAVHFPSWEEKTPLVFAYLRCINCSTAGINSSPEIAVQIDPAGLTPAEIVAKIKEAFGSNDD